MTEKERFSEWWQKTIRQGHDGTEQRRMAASFVQGKEIAIQKKDYDLDRMLVTGKLHQWHITKAVIDPSGRPQFWSRSSFDKNFPDSASKVVTWCGRTLEDVFLEIGSDQSVPGIEVCMTCFKRLILNSVLSNSENGVKCENNPGAKT